MDIKSVLRSVGGRLLPKSVLVNGKRTIFMATLYLKMMRESNPTKDTLEECNRRLGLTDDANALKLPAVLGEVIWSDKTEAAFRSVDQSISCGDLDGVCQKVMSITPAWLKYDQDPVVMQHDIEAVAMSVSARRATA